MSEELNKAAHEAMGKCLGKWEGDNPYDSAWDKGKKCLKCGVPNYDHMHEVPNYCSDLNAAAELEAFTIEKVGGGYYGKVLLAKLAPISSDTIEPRLGYYDVYLAATTTAEQRVKACLEALKQV